MFETSLLFPSQASADTGDSLLKKVLALGWKKALLIFLAISGLASTALGVWQLVGSSERAEDNLVPLVESVEPEGTAIYIDVSGAVEQPGVYQLSLGDRVASALAAAGGATNRADAQYLNTTLNLSARIQDEQKIYIPFEGEGGIAVDLEVANINAVSSEEASPLLSINTASASELDTLPRIGQATAEKIISGRPYVAIEDLLAKKILSEGVFAEIQHLIKI